MLAAHPIRVGMVSAIASPSVCHSVVPQPVYEFNLIYTTFYIHETDGRNDGAENKRANSR